MPGDPLPGITPVQFEEFRLGLDDFLEVETPEEGLGPAFNGTSCAACHSVPAIGGAGTIAEVRAGKRDAAGRFEALDATGETLFHLFSIPTHGCQPIVPADATMFARRVPIPLFGAGLVEAIPDETLLALEDPFDRDRDGVCGRAARVEDAASGERARRPLRLEGAARDAAGVQRRRLPQRDGHHERHLPAARSPTAYRPSGCASAIRFPSRKISATPARGRRGIDNFTSFMQLLAPAGARWLERNHPRRGGGLRRDRVRGVSPAVADNGTKRRPAFQSAGRPVVLGSAAARRRHGRRHRAGQTGRKTRSGRRALGPEIAPSAAARRLGGDDRRGHPPSRRRG